MLAFLSYLVRLMWSRQAYMWVLHFKKHAYEKERIQMRDQHLENTLYKKMVNNLYCLAYKKTERGHGRGMKNTRITSKYFRNCDYDREQFVFDAYVAV